MKDKIAPLPEFVKTWIQKPKAVANIISSGSTFDSKILKGGSEGSRNDNAAKLIGKLLAHFPVTEWETTAWEIVASWNKSNTPPLDEQELRSVFESIKKRQVSSQKEEGEDEKKQTAIIFVEEIKNKNIKLFHNQYKEGYAALNGDGSAILRVRSKEFRRYVSHFMFKNTGKIISQDSLNNIIQLTEALALFEGEYHELYVRIASKGNGVFYDLGDGKAVYIDKDGWSITNQPPILFRRFPHQTNQVIPKEGGKVTDLLWFVNIKNEQEQLLFLVYTIAAFIPDFPHPILVLHGAQGASKTTALKMLKLLVDPSIIKTLSAPDSEREFVQLASHHYFFFFDNLSKLPSWLSDSLAKASTGDGFSKRELFSDDDDVIYSFQRTIGIDGINQVVEKADLLDRSILLGLERIPKEARREERIFWQEFDEVRSYALGAIFSAVSEAMKRYPEIELSSLPRMADFTRWGCAIAESIGFTQKDFLSAYFANINLQSDAALDASPVGTAIVGLMEDRNDWEGTASDLLTRLDDLAKDLKLNVKAHNWPKDPSWLVRRLETVVPSLQEQGIKVIRDIHSRPKRIVLQKVTENADDGDMESIMSIFGVDGNTTASVQEPPNADTVPVSETKQEVLSPSAPTPLTANLQDIEDSVLKALAEVTMTKGFVPAWTVADKLQLPVPDVRKALNSLYANNQILRYGEEQDSWAVSVAKREELGIPPPTRK